MRLPGPLGPSVFLASGTGTILGPLPLGGRMVLAFGPSPATWAVVSVRTLSNSILALGDHVSSMLTPSFSFAVGLHTLAAPSSLASCWARWRWEGLVWPCLTPLSLSLVWLAFGGGLLLDCTGFGGRCFHLPSAPFAAHIGWEGPSLPHLGSWAPSFWPQWVSWEQS